MNERLYPITIEVNGTSRTGHVTARTSPARRCAPA
jgi:hypothetical protein